MNDRRYDHNNQRFLKYTEELVFIPPDPQESIAMESMAFGEEELDGAGGGTYELQRVKEDKYIEQYFEKDTVDNTESHIFLNSTKIATANNNDNPYFILSDHLNSSSILTDNSGNIAEQTDYTPYGRESYTDVTNDLGDDYRFVGKEKDEENNLQYFGARYNDNELGKFISIDPILLKINSNYYLLENPQKINSYSYGYNNPVYFVDIDGNEGFSWRDVPIVKQTLNWIDKNPAKGANATVGITPVVGDAQDLYQVISGKETFTNKELSSTERTISAIAVPLPIISGRILKEGLGQVAKNTDEIKTLYHGSVDNFGDIMKDGFSNFKNLHLTENIVDAVKYSQKRTNALDPGVVPVEVPRKFFDDFIKPFKDDRYTDFEYKILDSKTVDKINNFLNKK